MKIGDQRKYDLENFKGLYPLIDVVLKQLTLTAKRAEYTVEGITFEIRQNGDLIEMGLPIESPIFPTLTFKKLLNDQVELLQYRISESFKDSIFKATGMFVRGRSKVSVLFKKTLGSGVKNEISYESTIPNRFNQVELSTVTLELDKLRNVELKGEWDKQQPNANKLFANKVASLVVYYGDVEAFGNKWKQAIQVTEDSIFIMWRVESVEYLSSIANNLRGSNEAHLRMDLDVDDEFFFQDEAMYKAVINKISLTFN